jgi:Helix-turn-helix domain
MEAEMSNLDQAQLAERWHVSPRTLEQWRWRGTGPRYLKLGGRVLYRLADIEAFEGCVSNVVEIGGRRNLPGATKHR